MPDQLHQNLLTPTQNKVENNLLSKSSPYSPMTQLKKSMTAKQQQVTGAQATKIPKTGKISSTSTNTAITFKNYQAQLNSVNKKMMMADSKVAQDKQNKKNQNLSASATIEKGSSARDVKNIGVSQFDYRVPGASHTAIHTPKTTKVKQASQTQLSNQQKQAANLQKTINSGLNPSR